MTRKIVSRNPLSDSLITMNSLELVSQAMKRMKYLQETVEGAADVNWQEECLSDLAKVSGLDLVSAPKCAVSICATCTIEQLPCGAPAAVHEMAIKIAAAGGDTTNQTEKLVDYWLQQFPPERSSFEAWFDVLGRYFPQNKEAPRAEIYWIKIAQYLRGNSRPSSSLADVSKVIMLHELAHYVTHHGKADGKDWCRFQRETTEAVEFAAQVGCEQVITARRFEGLKDAFNELCDGPPPQSDPYRVHREIVPELEKLKELWAVQVAAAGALNLPRRTEAVEDDEWGNKAGVMRSASSIGRIFQDPNNKNLHCVWLFVRHFLRPRQDRGSLSDKTKQLGKHIEDLRWDIAQAPILHQASNECGINFDI